MLKNEQIDLIINTTEGRQSIADSAVIRRLALQQGVLHNHAYRWRGVLYRDSSNR